MASHPAYPEALFGGVPKWRKSTLLRCLWMPFCSCVRTLATLSIAKPETYNGSLLRLEKTQLFAAVVPAPAVNANAS